MNKKLFEFLRIEEMAATQNMEDSKKPVNRAYYEGMLAMIIRIGEFYKHAYGDKGRRMEVETPDIYEVAKKANYWL